MPRPPDTTLRAAVCSGRSDFDSWEDINLDAAPWAVAATSSIVALPPVVATGSKEAARTVSTFLPSEDFTVAMALPA